jgi:hypothetical protein
MPRKAAPIQVETHIVVIRGQRVILDQDLARQYGVETKVLLQAIKRNAERFPSDFVFRLDMEEFSRLRSQIVTAKGRGGRRSAPLAFTAEGVAMLSGVLSSPRAIAVNIAIMREFVRLRDLAGLRDYALRKLEALENRVDQHDVHFERAFEAIERMIAQPEPSKPRIGFGRDEETNKLKNRKS